MCVGNFSQRDSISQLIIRRNKGNTPGTSVASFQIIAGRFKRSSEQKV
jgi:hypothetical protein